MVDLLAILQTVLRSPVDAVEVLDGALRESGRREPPRMPSVLVAFVRAHLLERVAEVSGPHVASDLLDEVLIAAAKANQAS